MKRFNYPFYLLIVVVIFLSGKSLAQYTKVRGTIIDAETKEPVPFVNVAFSGIQIGSITNFNGEYFIETREKVDSMRVSFVGYKSQSFNINPNSYQSINVELRESAVDLSEIVVRPGKNPAHKILRNIIKNKDRNNPDHLSAYQYEVYTKAEVDINNIDSSYRSKRFYKNFPFIFDYIDTSVVTGKPFLPVFISETVSDYYYRKDPERKKEIIEANKISGMKNESISQFTGQMYQDINVYRNFNQIFGLGFISPLSDRAMLYYKYYLIDSMFIDNKWCHQISFKPKRKQELTFTGDFWVNDTSFAIKKINVRIAEDANINYVNDLYASYEYEEVGEIWFISKDHIVIDFNLTNKSTGFFGRKTTTYRNIVLNEPKEVNFFAGNVTHETVLEEESIDRDLNYWREARHINLSAKEESIYNMVDSIKEVPIFKNLVDYLVMFVTGYYVYKNFEFGPYYTFYSFNPIEGNRIKIGGRSSNDFSTKLMLYGHLAYGTLDKKFKYGLGTMYIFSKNPRITAGISFSDDNEQLGQSQNAFLKDNILTSVLRREYNYKLTRVKQLNAYFEKEWYQGFSNTLTLNHRTLYSTSYIPFEDVNNGDFKNYIITTELTLNTHYAYNEKFIYGEFIRTSLGSKYPMVNLYMTYGIKDFFHADYNYFKLNLNLEHNFNNNPFGNFKYIIDAGKYWGTTPYPLMQLHQGNETYAFDDYAFNMMNYYEFVSDKYLSVFAEQHFEGFFLNRIPLFRKLKWREIASAKVLYGDVSNKNKNILEFPDLLTGLSKPYAEASLGVENVFKIFRVDAMWRLSYLDNANIPKFGIRAKMQVEF